MNRWTVARALGWLLALGLALAGIPLTYEWLTNLGPVRIWHLAGPASLSAAILVVWAMTSDRPDR